MMQQTTGWQDDQSEFELQVNKWIPRPAIVFEDSNIHPVAPQNSIQNQKQQYLISRQQNLHPD